MRCEIAGRPVAFVPVEAFHLLLAKRRRGDGAGAGELIMAWVPRRRGFEACRYLKIRERTSYAFAVCRQRRAADGGRRDCGGALALGGVALKPCGTGAEAVLAGARAAAACSEGAEAALEAPNVRR